LIFKIFSENLFLLNALGVGGVNAMQNMVRQFQRGAAGGLGNLVEFGE
jgi:hypothetical protein